MSKVPRPEAPCVLLTRIVAGGTPTAGAVCVMTRAIILFECLVDWCFSTPFVKNSTLSF